MGVCQGDWARGIVDRERGGCRGRGGEGRGEWAGSEAGGNEMSEGRMGAVGLGGYVWIKVDTQPVTLLWIHLSFPFFFFYCTVWLARS